MVTTISQLPHAVQDVRPGDQDATAEVDGWLLDHASNRDPRLRERIILSYLGLADRLASRYRTSRGATPEDLRQTARAGLIAAVDRYDPGLGSPFVAYAVACVVGELNSLGDLVAAPAPREEPEDLLALPSMVAALPELEREVIVLRFFQDLDQYEIAARVGFSQMHVSRLQRRALARMRTQLMEP